jgi:tetratricopeptide (TPR) repeat protein
LYLKVLHLSSLLLVLHVIAAVSQEPSDPLAEVKVLEASGQLSEAALVLKNYLDTRPRDPESRLTLAKITMNLGSYSVAESMVKELLKENPKNEPALILLAELLRRQGKTYEMLASLNAFLKTGERALAVHQFLGDFFYQQEDFRSAEYHYAQIPIERMDETRKSRFLALEPLDTVTGELIYRAEIFNNDESRGHKELNLSVSKHPFWNIWARGDLTSYRVPLNFFYQKRPFAHGSLRKWQTEETPVEEEPETIYRTFDGVLVQGGAWARLFRRGPRLAVQGGYSDLSRVYAEAYGLAALSYAVLNRLEVTLAGDFETYGAATLKAGSLDFFFPFHENAAAGFTTIYAATDRKAVEEVEKNWSFALRTPIEWNRFTLTPKFALGNKILPILFVDSIGSSASFSASLSASYPVFSFLYLSTELGYESYASDLSSFQFGANANFHF